MTILERIKNSTYFRQIASLATGTAIAQVITVVAYVFLARIYSIDDFGSFKLFESIIYVTVIASTLAFEHAIILPDKRKSALKILFTATSSVLITSIFLFPTALLVDEFAGHKIELETILILLIPFGIILVGFINSFNNWFVFLKKFSQLSRIKVVQSSTSAITQIAIGVWSLAPFGLVFGFLTGRVVSVLSYLFSSGVRLSDITEVTKKDSIKEVFEEHKDQPRFVLPAKLIQQFSIEIPVLLTSFLFNNTLLGLLALALKALSTPTQFIGISVGQVYYKQISERKNNQKAFKDLLLKTWLGLFLVGVIPFTLLMIYGSEIFSIVFGTEWEEAGLLASLLAPALLTYFVIGPTERATFMVLGLQSKILFFVIIDMFCKTIGMLIGYFLGSYETAILSISILQAATLLIMGGYLYQSTSKYDASVAN